MKKKNKKKTFKQVEDGRYLLRLQKAKFTKQQQLFSHVQQSPHTKNSENAYRITKS